MFEAYKIGVRIGVVDATGGGILKIASQFARAQKEASAFLTTLRKVNEELRRSARGWASGAADDFNRARRAAENYTSSASRAARYAGPGAGMMAMAAFAGGYGGGGGARGQMFLGGPSPLALGYGGGAGGGGGGGIGMPMAAGMAGRFSGGGMRAAGFLWPRGPGGGGGGRSGGGGGIYGGMGRLFGGMMLEHAGRAELGMLATPIDAAAQYQSAVARFTLYGLGDKLNGEAIKFANSMQIIGTSMTDAVNFMTEAQGVFRESGLSGSKSLEGAKLAAPMLAKIAFATAGLDGESRAKMHTQSLEMLRFIEMRGGLTSASHFNSIAEQGWKAIRSSGGNVNWAQLRQFMATGGVAAQGLTNQALFGELEPIIGELKGGGAGHAFMTAYSRVNGLQRLIPRIMQREMMRLGLWDKSKIEFNNAGGVKSFDGDPLKNANLFSSSPFQYYKSVVLPAYAKAGITKPEDVYRENAIIFGNTGGKLFSIMYRQMHNIELSVEAQRKTMGIDASVGATKGTFAGQLLNYHKQMETLQIQLGLVVLPMLIRALKWLNPHIQQMAEWIGSHSTLTKGLVIVFAALGGLAMISGSIVAIGGAFTMIGAAITAGGGLLAGLGGVAAALTAVGTAVGVFLTTYAAYEAGKSLGQKIDESSPTGHKVIKGYGSLMMHVMAFAGDSDAKAALARGSAISKWANSPNDAWDEAALKANKSGSAFVAPRKGQPVQVNSTVMLDGKRVGQAVTTHMANDAARAQAGRSGFDPTAAAPPIGLNYAH